MNSYVGQTGSLALLIVSLIGQALADDAAPAAPPEDRFTAAGRSHWAFQPVRSVAAPLVKQTELVRTPIDAFLLSRLEELGLTYSRDAGRQELIRRLKFDLLGLPPTSEEVDEFVADTRPDAYERLVDRYLACPQYGEAWGRMWLDVVRYADTAGYNADPLRPLAWQYRDYVIRSFNEDKPFDRFVREQIAGDELYPDDRQALLGTGYLRMWPDESNASNILLARQDALNDLTGNLGAAFLGLSLACTQCHDHKFDPIPQRDYYALQSFFSGITPVDKVASGTPAEVADFRRREREWLDVTEPVRRELQEIEVSARIPLTAEKRMKFPKIVLDAIDTHPDRRSTMQRQLVFWSERQIDYKDADLLKKLTDEQKARREELKKSLADLKKSAPKPPSEIAALSISESDGDIPPTHILSTGSYDKPEEPVSPGFLSILFRPQESVDAAIAPAATGSTGRRTALANWLTDPRNPLVGRVIVNRIWQDHFGRGLVENANDFGTQTPPPSHPELLDWLVLEGRGTRDESPGTEAHLSTDPSIASVARPSSLDPRPTWSFKRLHRLIVLSSAYRQSTGVPGADSARSEEHDPDNDLYWKFPRRRLSAERVRDAILAVSGQLNTAMTGPGVCPPLPPGYNGREAWPTSSSPRDHVRRSVYIQAKRNLPFPMLAAFDLPDMHESCACRSRTTTAPQALMLLNSEMARSAAEEAARRILADESADSPESLATAAWRAILGRPADAAETESAVRFLRRQLRLTETERTNLSRPSATYSGAAVAETGHEPLESAVADLCHVLLNSNEFLYLE